jgi:pectate lyase
VHWISNNTIVAVSDNIKADEQDGRCNAKDESIHVFALPNNWDEALDELLAEV